MPDKIRILLAEDFDIIRADFRDRLNALPDMEVVGEAASCAEIVALAQSVPADVVLMDMEMEDMYAGIRATEQILDLEPAPAVIFLTVHETEELVLAALAAGAVDYVVKSAYPEEIFEHVRGVYRKEPMMEPKIQALVHNEFIRLKRSEESLFYFVNKFSTLTQSERAILRLLLLDKSTAQIAEIRSVELVTVKTQIQGILRKVGLSRTKAIVKTLRNLGLDKLILREWD